MILQSLVSLYEDLEKRGEIAPFGWTPQKISFAVYLREDGSVERIVSVKAQEKRGEKTVTVPREMTVPRAEHRTSGIKSNFLWDNAEYLFGLATKGKPEKAMECFDACRSRHEELLSEVDHPAALALKRFFASWEPKDAAEHPAILPVLKELSEGGNLVFRYGGHYLHEIPQLREAWNRYFEHSSGAGETGRCLVTGKTGPIAPLHPPIKGIAGAQSSGASLVSFNDRAFCSYGHEQGQNAPTGAYAAFAYGAALNHLIADRDSVNRIGDTTVVCWAAGGERAYAGLMGDCTFGNRSPYQDAELAEMVRLLTQGKPVTFDETRIEPERPFTVLGLSPNGGRLSVRLFLQNTFGNILKNVEAHNERLRIAGLDRPLSLGRLLKETVNPNAKNASAAPGLAGETLRAIVTGGAYPATLLNALNVRIRADRVINSARAAIIKAYYLNNTHPLVPKEVLQVHLNPESHSVPYQLGRLFAVLESIQKTANPGIQATIKDKFFGSACATPATVFPQLLGLAQKHLRKIGGGLEVTLNRRLGEIMDRLGEDFPPLLSLPEQGAFQLGYYQQNLELYAKKEEKDHV